MDKIYTKDRRYKIEVRKVEDRYFAVCSNCGVELTNFKIKAIETGTFYCSESCCKEEVKNNAPEGGY